MAYPTLQPWLALKWIGYIALVAAVAHALMTVTLEQVGLTGLMWEQIGYVVVNVGLVVCAFGPAFEPVIAAEHGWPEAREQSWKWRLVRVLYLLGIVAGALLWGRLLSAVLVAAAG